MPIRAPDEVKELRVTLGRKEYEQLKKFEETQRTNVWLDAIPNIGFAAMGAGVLFGGLAGLTWVGMSVREIIDSGIEAGKEYTNKASNWLTDYVVENDLMNPISDDEVSVWKRIEFIGERIKEIHVRQGEISDFIHSKPTPPYAAIQAHIREGMKLEEEENALRDELDKITTGELTIIDHYPAA